jgi:hypothetical protein
MVSATQSATTQTFAGARLRRRWPAGLTALVCLAPLFAQAPAPLEVVGQIEGDAIAVKGAISVEVENGRSTTLLGSGSEVTVRSGQARLTLIEGGEIGICAPAQFSLLKSGGAITLALNYGRVHAQLGPSVPLSVYTPQVVATPIAVGAGLRDSTVGLDSAGAMCVRAERGAVRLELQFTGENLLVPQSGEIALAGGQLDALRETPGGCQCEILAVRAVRAAGPPAERGALVVTELARPIRPPLKKEKPETSETPKPPAVDEPIYKVLMPPLMFDASKPTPPPDPSLETILLVRKARVRPSVVFHGRVETPPAPPAPLAAHEQLASAQRPPSSEDRPAKKEVTLATRIKNFFRRLTLRGPCAGVGCG